MKMTNCDEIIHGSDVAEVWTRLFARAMEPGCDHLGPTMVRIRTDDARQMVESDSPVRSAIDAVLRVAGSPRVKETASLIFPYSPWRAKLSDIDALTTWYVGEFMPRLKVIAPSQFRHTYFERMVDFDGTGTSDSSGNNQLKFILDRCAETSERRTHFRQSGLQVSIFDPRRDHTRSAQKNFPCLQQLGFYFLEDGSLGLSAYYPTQVIVERAYGNYLGLCQLGVFMAHQLEVPFREFVCFVGSPRLNFKKKDLRELESQLLALQREIDTRGTSSDADS